MERNGSKQKQASEFGEVDEPQRTADGEPLEDHGIVTARKGAKAPGKAAADSMDEWGNPDPPVDETDFGPGGSV